MDAFEQDACNRGCRLVYLDTISFQAPSFYQTRGYVEVLRTEGFTGGVIKLTMHKRLDGVALRSASELIDRGVSGWQ